MKSSLSCTLASISAATGQPGSPVSSMKPVWTDLNHCGMGRRTYALLSIHETPRGNRQGEFRLRLVSRLITAGPGGNRCTSVPWTVVQSRATGSRCPLLCLATADWPHTTQLTLPLYAAVQPSTLSWSLGSTEQLSHYSARGSSQIIEEPAQLLRSRQYLPIECPRSRQVDK